MLKYFSSSYTHKVEPKGRVSIPSDYRKILEAMKSSQIVVLPQFRSPLCHVALSQSGYERLIERFEGEAPGMAPERREAHRVRLIARACPLTLDEVGRIVLPQTLRESIGIAKEVTFVGAGSTFELWQPENRREYERAFERPDSAMAEDIDLGGLH